MKYLFLLIAISFHLNLNAQDMGTKFYFKEIGWHVVLPHSFIMNSVEEDEKDLKAGIQLIENTNDIKVGDFSDLKDLISATKSNDDYINATIRTYNLEEDGDFLDGVDSLKVILYNTFNSNPNLGLDTLSTKLVIDNLTFEKFTLNIKVDNKPYITMVVLFKLYKGYDFGITYLYQDQKSKLEIEKMLSESKFDK